MLVDRVRSEMVAALKEGKKERKSILSLLVANLDKAAKDKRDALTEDEENQVVLKMCKQLQETVDTCPTNRQDIRDKAEYELSVVSEFAPKMMSEVEICDEVQKVLDELGLETYEDKYKGQVMKILMPRVKGKADGKLVNLVLAKWNK